MSTIAAPPPTMTEPVASNDLGPVRSSAWRIWLWRPLKLLVGMVCCQSPLTTLLVVGWTHRSMGRLIHRGAVIEPNSHTNLFLRVLRQAWSDFRHGFAVVANVLLMTLPATGLWYLAWLLGWNVSFFKGYEQSHLGAGLGLSGILMFSLVMLYVPLAVCHQSATRNWKAFWDVSTICRLVWNAGWWHVFLAATFALLSVPVMIARMTPYFLTAEGDFDNFTDRQLVSWLSGYYFWISLVSLPAFWLAWRSAALVYRGRVSGKNVAVVEVPVPGGLSILSRMFTVAGLTCAALVWMAAAFEVFVAQFFNYIPGQGWLVHPVVVMPWLRFIPAELLGG